MPRNYVKLADRKPGAPLRPNGTRITKPTAADLQREAGQPQPAAEPGDGESAGGSEAGTVFLDPREGESAGGSEAAGGGERKARKLGRPAVSPSNSPGPTQKKKVSASLEGIEGILLSIHMMGATLLKVPELVMSEDEAKKLSEAMNRVASFYDVGASEKTLAWVNLAVCAGGIYGTRAFAYHLRLKAEAESKKQLAQAQPARPSVVMPFGGAPAAV